MLGYEFPNPCPVCGADDDHAKWLSGIPLNACGDLCPHRRRKATGRAAAAGGMSREMAKRRMAEVLTSPPPPLTPDAVRQLLRECVTVVGPGETVILRVPWTTTPTQVRELQDFVNGTAEWLNLPFKTLILPGDELGVAESASVSD